MMRTTTNGIIWSVFAILIYILPILAYLILFYRKVNIYKRLGLISLVQVLSFLIVLVGFSAASEDGYLAFAAIMVYAILVGSGLFLNLLIALILWVSRRLNEKAVTEEE